jgi:hypothetical protein
MIGFSFLLTISFGLFFFKQQNPKRLTYMSKEEGSGIDVED